MVKTRAIAKPSLMLCFLYKTMAGRCLLRFLSARGVSDLCGRFLDSTLSRFLVRPFIKNNHIDLSLYMEQTYNTFNDCFCRRIKPECRPVDMDPTHLVSPCDGLLSVYPIRDHLVVPVKQSEYTLEDLLRDRALAEKYKDGICLVFRLCVDHYHRYCYPVDCRKSHNRFIEGVLHTVRPIALESQPVFTQNCREYTMLRTRDFGDVIQMEVGAMLVGKIDNYHQRGEFHRGEEKGRFLYGGSTIILLLEKDRVHIPEAYLAATMHDEEVEVCMGQCIGTLIAQED